MGNRKNLKGSVNCGYCGEPTHKFRGTKAYCSSRCRVYAYRDKKRRERQTAGQAGGL